MRIKLPVILALLFLSACGAAGDTRGPDGGTDPGAGSPDGGGNTLPDAGTDAGTPPAPTCTASRSYSGPVGGTARKSTSASTGDVLTFSSDMPGGDRIVVSMFANFGTPGLNTGTYDMADRTKVLTNILTDISTSNTGGSTWTAYYKSVSGTLQVTSVSGKFSGTITDGTFTSADEPGCTVSVPTMTFEGIIQ